MADTRFIVSWGPGSDLTADWFSNTLYFAVDGSIDDPDIQGMAEDIAVVYRARTWCAGSKIEVRGYLMSDAKPRPERGFATSAAAGTYPTGAAQIALCLSYYSERNLPRQRGRIYCGPFGAAVARPPQTTMNELITHGQALAGIGGINVDWSVYSPTKAALGQDPTMSISDIWVDNRWDVVRSRAIASTARTEAQVNE